MEKITEITATNFKGLSFTQPLGKKTIFLGPNGAGKSARTQALILAVMGYIPGAGKTNAALLDTYGGDKMVVGFQADGKHFQRGFARNGDKVSAGYKVNGRKSSDKEFAQILGAIGNPHIVDIGAFMELSAKKKIDALFDLFPPTEDVGPILENIEKIKTKISVLTKKAESEEDAAARMTAARTALQMPPGTLAELDAKIKQTEETHEKARDELQAEKERIKAEEKANRDALLAKMEADAAALKTASAPVAAPVVDRLGTHIFSGGKLLREEAAPAGRVFSSQRTAEAPNKGTNTAAESIRAILKALQEGGCNACAARLVAMRELRKFREEVAA